jgi:hypothetical protein
MLAIASSIFFLSIKYHIPFETNSAKEQAIRRKKKYLWFPVNSIYLPGTITFSHLAVKK